MTGYSDHLFKWSDFLACHESMDFPIWNEPHKSGIGSCIAPKAGLARHPAKGRAAPVDT